MSVIPVFNKINTFVYALSTIADSTVNGYWAGYFTGASSSLGATANTTTVWQDVSGFYLFMDKTPIDWTLFANELSQLRSNFDPQNKVRCVWIENADQLSLKWNIKGLYANATGTGSTIVWQQLRACSFEVDMYLFSTNGLNTLTYVTDANGGGISFSGGALFSGPEGGYTLPLIQILFSGLTIGCFNGILNAPVPTTALMPDVWTALNIGLQYGVAPPIVTDNNSSTNQSNDDTSYANITQLLFMPIFVRQTVAISLGLVFDPLNLLVATRTALNLFSGNGIIPPTLNSYLRTSRGYQVKLNPITSLSVIPAAQFTFGKCPVFGSATDSVNRYHLSPNGAFQITVVNPETSVSAPTIKNQVLMGLSGLEYIELGGTNYMAVFQSNMPAFIPAIDSTSIQPPDVSKALTSNATTSHFNILSYNSEPIKPIYFAQPREAPVFSGQYSRSDGILDFNPMPSHILTYNALQLPAVFPIGIYAGLTSELSTLAREIENASLAPYRNYSIGKTYGVGSVELIGNSLPIPQRRVRGANDPLGVTPQGLIAELTTDYSDFDGLLMGNMPGTNYPKVDLTAVTGLFKESLQSNQLFFVSSNVDVLMSCTSVRYKLTAEDKPYLLALNVPQATIDSVYAAVTASGIIQPFETEGQFVACIKTAASTYLNTFLSIAGILKVEMDGWTFQLSPRTWRKNSDSPTMMLAKFCNRTLIDLANDTSSWLWPDVATPATVGSTWPGITNPTTPLLKQTQTALLNLLNNAGDKDASVDLKNFYNTVVNNPNWNGFLFLNAPVDIGEFPDNLKFLTAGIDLTKFYAHHIGFSQTPFSILNGKPDLQQTAAFGLIDYEDTEDLYAEESIALGFKTMRLKARFANASLVDFSTQIELMLNQLLGSELSKTIAARGNNLIIDGSYQRVGGAPAYAFTLTGQNVFNANNSALTSIEVTAVQLINGGNAGDVNILSSFILSGNLRFYLNSDFDLFSFGPDADGSDGYLSYSGLSIDMSFSLAQPKIQTFVVRENNIAFDINSSLLRKSSLLNNFPLTITSMLASKNLSGEGETPSGQTPEDLGYTSVSAQFDQTPMVPDWYGLVYTLDLGTFGALTGSVSFKLSVLAAWSKGSSSSSIPVYIGLKLPGISAIAGSFPVQGVLKIGFRSFQFETYTTTDNQTAYLLRMRRFALSVLVWSFPPGNADIVLFGQPGNPRGSLGWYAAYDEDEKKDKEKSIFLNQVSTETTTTKTTDEMVELDSVQRRLKSGRRKPPIG